MRVFAAESGREYSRLPFEYEHDEQWLESWLEKYPDSLDEPLMIIGRQVHTDGGGVLDLFGLNARGDTVVLELKRDRAPRDTIAQALVYAAFVSRLRAEDLEAVYRDYQDDTSLVLGEHHRKWFKLEASDSVTFNADQRVVIVGQTIGSALRATASWLGSYKVRISCVEFGFSKGQSGDRLLSLETVAQGSAQSRRVMSESLPKVSEEAFMATCDEHGRGVFGKILGFARERALSVSWGVKGFSLGVEVAGSRVAFCACYPPAAAYEQSFRTWLYSPGGVATKSAASGEAVEALREQARESGLFRPSGRELKCLVDETLTDADKLFEWCESAYRVITSQELREGEE